MASETYRFVRHTCDVDEVIGDLAGAQQRFSEHASDGCEVVLKNREPLDPDPTINDRPSEDSSDGPKPVDD